MTGCAEREATLSFKAEIRSRERARHSAVTSARAFLRWLQKLGLETGQCKDVRRRQKTAVFVMILRCHRSEGGGTPAFEISRMGGGGVMSEDRSRKPDRNWMLGPSSKLVAIHNSTVTS